MLSRVRVIVVSKGVKGSELEKLHLTPARDVGEALEAAEGLVGRKPKILVIPEDPCMIPAVGGRPPRIPFKRPTILPALTVI